VTTIGRRWQCFDNLHPNNCRFVLVHFNAVATNTITGAGPFDNVECPGEQLAVTWHMQELFGQGKTRPIEGS